MSDSAHVTTHNSSVDEWTRALAESVGSPGGGAGAGVMLAMAASLISMVAGYTDPEPQRRRELDDLRDRAHSLRQTALQLADDDAEASEAFGAAFTLPAGEERDEAIREASLGASRSSAILGEHAMGAIADVEWLASHGKPALIADVVVAFGALRAAAAGARTNASFDLAVLKFAGTSMDEIRANYPELSSTVEQLSTAIERIDAATAAVDDRAAPTDRT